MDATAESQIAANVLVAAMIEAGTEAGVAQDDLAAAILRGFIELVSCTPHRIAAAEQLTKIADALACSPQNGRA